jgi:hypothetical protein
MMGFILKVKQSGNDMLVRELAPGDLLKPMEGYELLKNSKKSSIDFLHSRLLEKNVPYMIYVRKNNVSQKYEVLLDGVVWQIKGKNIKYLKKISP